MKSTQNFSISFLFLSESSIHTPYRQYAYLKDVKGWGHRDCQGGVWEDLVLGEGIMTKNLLCLS